MEKIVLVTGAAGFIGRYVARCFHEHGWYVIGLGHGSWSEAERDAWGIDEWHMEECNFTGLSAVRGERASVIVHAAGSGSVGFSVKNPESDFFRNTGCTSEVLGFIRQCASPAKLVFLSSAAVYGESRHMPLCEDEPLNPISPYGVHKKMAEELCVMYARQYQVRCVILRFFSVYGEGLEKQLLWDACHKLSEGETSFFGTGQEVRDWVHVEDAARAIVIGVQHASSDCPVANVGSGLGTSIKDVLELLFSSCDSKDTPRFTGMENVGNPSKYIADTSRIRSWGWTPEIPLDIGISRYVRWHRRVAGQAKKAII